MMGNCCAFAVVLVMRFQLIVSLPHNLRKQIEHFRFLKIIEEQAAMSRRLARRARERGHDLFARDFEAKVQDAEQRAMVLQQILWKGMPQNPLDQSKERA